MIKKTSLTILTLLSLASPALYAADQPFTGPAIAGGLSISGISNKVDPSSDYKAVVIDNSATWSSGTGSKTSVLPVIDFSWNVPIAPTWVAGAGVDLELSKQSGPEKTISTVHGTQSTSFDMKQQASIYGLVGKQLGDNWLLYGKLAYHQAKVDAKLHDSGNPPDLNESYTLHGTGFGVGAIYALQKNLELRMEGEYISYNGFTQKADDYGTVSNKPAVARVNVMIGYRF